MPNYMANLNSGGVRNMLLPLFLYLFAQCAVVQAVWQYADPQRYPGVPSYGPKPGPDYMVDNQNNYYGKAPDKGKQSLGGNTFSLGTN
jgi:hypothetical protein